MSIQMDSNNFTFHAHVVNYIKRRQDLIPSKAFHRSSLNYFRNDSMTHGHTTHFPDVRFPFSHFNETTEMGNSSLTLFTNHCKLPLYA